MWNPNRAPKGADYARDIIATMERETKSRKARVRLAEIAISHGNYTDEAKQEFRNYLARA